MAVLRAIGFVAPNCWNGEDFSVFLPPQFEAMERPKKVPIKVIRDTTYISQALFDFLKKYVVF